MTLILTGSPTRYGEDHITTDNGLLAAVQAALPAQPRVLLVSAAPDDRAFTDSVLESMTGCIRNSGISPAGVVMLDRRNAALARELRPTISQLTVEGVVPSESAFSRTASVQSLLIPCFISLSFQ